MLVHSYGILLELAFMNSSILTNSCKKIINKIFIFEMVASTYNVIKSIENFVLQSS